MEFEHFIPQNVAPKGAKRIVLYHSDSNKKIGRIELGGLALPSMGKKKYSALFCADVHITNGETDDGALDFIRATQYAENCSDIAFICVCGDLADSYNEYVFTKVKNLIGQCKKPVYAITGNHETYPVGSVGFDAMTPYYGRPLYYSFEYQDDVYIMLGEYGWTDCPPFADGELQFLYDTLEANRNKRCFVFQHIFMFDESDSGQPYRTFYSFDIFDMENNKEVRAKQKECFLSLLRHYKNAIWFHGHSHAMFQLQAMNKTTVYSEKLGYRSVHIPSLSKPKNIVDGAIVSETAGSQGYIADVYDNHIVLRGRDFVGEEFLPIASYCLDTTLQTVEAGTYKDSTGTITVVNALKLPGR